VVLPLQKPMGYPTPLAQPVSGPLRLQQPTIPLRPLERPPVPVRLSVRRDQDGWAVYSADGQKVAGPFATEFEASDISTAMGEMLGSAPISEYQKMGGSLKYQEPTEFKIEGRPVPEPKEIKSNGLLDPIKEMGTSILDFFIEKSEGADSLLTTSPQYEFWDNWQKHYNTIQTVDQKMRDKVKNTPVSPLAEGPIDIAVEIFGGDMGYPAWRLRKDLENIGKVESDYKHEVAFDNKPERSFWQIHPDTAMDALENASALFGQKFEDHFGKRYGGYKGLKKKSWKEIQQLLLDDRELAAAFAAIKVVRTFED